MDPTVELLDKKIEELEGRVNRIKASMDQLPALEADLDTLRRSRAILLGHPRREQEDMVDAAAAGRGQNLSDAILSILAASKSPMNVEQVMVRLRGIGQKPNQNSVWGTLARFTRAGKIVRKDKGLYASK